VICVLTYPSGDNPFSLVTTSVTFVLSSVVGISTDLVTATPMCMYSILRSLVRIWFNLFSRFSARIPMRKVTPIRTRVSSTSASVSSLSSCSCVSNLVGFLFGRSKLRFFDGVYNGIIKFHS